MGYIECPNCNINIDQTGKCYNAGDETECIKEPMKSIRGIPNEIRDELDKDSQRLFKVAFNEKFKECTDLEYDDFLREKTSMKYAFEQVKKNKGL